MNNDFKVIPIDGPFEQCFKDQEGKLRVFKMIWNDDKTATFYLDGEIVSLLASTEYKCQCQ